MGAHCVTPRPDTPQTVAENGSIGNVAAAPSSIAGHLASIGATVGNSELLDAGVPSKPSAIEVRNLHIRYGRFVAVQNLTLRIPEGEVFGFIGPNGAGKSSTIKVLATLQPKFEGSARVCGYDVVRQAQEVRGCMGFVPDFFGVYEDLSVREYLHFFAAAYQLPVARRNAVVDDVLQLTDLTGKIDSAVDVLSRGMKQRLSLARVLLHDPQVLLLDEPASGLDPRARIEMRELLKALRDMKKTILISSHILQELAELCTRIGIMEAGKLVAEGSVAEIYERLSVLQMVHVQVAGDPAPLIEQLKTYPGIASIEREFDRIAIRLSGPELSIEDLHDAIHATGARIRMFQPEAMDMETAFLKLTTGQTA